MAPRKPKPWAPPAGLKIDIAVSRGDITFRSEATPADALNVARLLTVFARQITREASDLLPHADSVPGVVLPYFDDDWADDGQKPGQKPGKPLGF